MTSASQESEKILAKVRMISDMMRAWELPRQPEECLSIKQQEEVLLTLSIELANVTIADKANPFIDCKPALLSSAHWKQLLITLIETFKSGSDVEFRAIEKGFSLERLRGSQNSEKTDEYSSFAELFIGRLGKCRVLYCWLDALLSQQLLTARLIYREELCRIEIRCSK